MFPAGMPGVALLMLRVSTGATLLINTAGDPLAVGSQWLFAALLALAASLVFGLLTPLVALACGALELMGVLGSDNRSAALIGLSAFNALALALLGPGAYSIDARLFGRRVMVFPADREQ